MQESWVTRMSENLQSNNILLCFTRSWKLHVLEAGKEMENLTNLMTESENINLQCNRIGLG